MPASDAGPSSRWLHGVLDMDRAGLGKLFDMSGRVVMAKVHIKRGETEKARQLLCQILVSSPTNESARKLLSEISGGVIAQNEALVTNPIEQAVTTPAEVVKSAETNFATPGASTEAAPDESYYSDEESDSDVKTPVYAALASATQRIPSWETVTMANIYLAQGHLERARGIYESILLRDPQNEQARRGLEELARMGG